MSMDAADTATPGSAPDTRKPTPVSRLPGPIDLRILEYVTDFDRHLQCPICRCPFIDPIRLSCDHTYCRLCYKRALQNQAIGEKSCPTCRQPIRDDTLPVPRFVTHMIEDLAVKCVNESQGCDAQLTRGDVQTHITYYCPFASVPCPEMDCSRLVARNRKAERCLHGLLVCLACRTEMMELDLEDHLQSRCTKLTTSCDACSLEFLRSDLEAHKQDCPEAVAQCTGVAVGCPFETKRRAIKYHVEKCPMASMAPHLKAMNTRMDDQAAMLRALQTKNDMLESSFATMQTLLMGGANAADSLSAIITRPSRNVEEDSQNPLFDSAAHHMLSLHEQLREELDRVTAAISDVDGRASMTIINETLRIREEMTHQNAVISNLRAQLQWLTSARLQAIRGPAGTSPMSAMGMQSSSYGSSEGQPSRRLSDPLRQETKL